jgi:hypothetical protein
MKEGRAVKFATLVFIPPKIQMATITLFGNDSPERPIVADYALQSYTHAYARQTNSDTESLNSATSSFWDKKYPNKIAGCTKISFSLVVFFRQNIKHYRTIATA